MADYAVTAANVQLTSGRTDTAEAGAAITAGDAIYIDSTDSDKAKLADVTTSSATAKVAGVALCDAAIGNTVVYAKPNAIIDMGITFTVGVTVVLSAAGAVAPHTDLATSDYISIIGVPSAADSIKLVLHNSGIVHA